MKPTYHSRMSNKKDERDIDEILASIDRMIAGKDLKTSTTRERQGLVEQVARDSEDALNLSSTAEQTGDTASRLQPFEPLDDDSSTTTNAEAHEKQITKTQTEETGKTASETKHQEPRPRIVLTEEFLEPSAQESLPLWAAQAHTTQDKPEDASVEDKSVGATRKTTDKSTAKNTEKDTSDEPFTFGETPVVSSQHANKPATDKTKEDEVGEAVSDERVGDNPTSDKGDMTEEPETGEPLKESSEHRAEATKSSEDDKKSEFDAVFDAIAADDAITFDISEAMNEDTVYDIEVLDKELVEAFVSDVAQDAEEEAEPVKDQAGDMGSTHTETEAESEMPEVEEELESAPVEVETDKQHAPQHVSQEELVFLNPDELDPLIEAVSDEVRIKINQHLQQILPELISDALLEHLANQPKQDH